MVRDLCDGNLEGAEIGSTEITFTPEKIRGGIHTADTKTAGYVILHLVLHPGFSSGAVSDASWGMFLNPLEMQFSPP